MEAFPWGGQTRETVTNESGLFSFLDLSFRRYQVTVTLAGFQTAVITNVVVESSRTTDLRVRLSVGGLEEVVTVEGASPVLERTSNLIASTLNNRALQELPLAGRDVFGLAVLVPGAASPQGGSPHYNGMPGARSIRRSMASTTRPTAGRAAARAFSVPFRRGSARSRRSPSKRRVRAPKVAPWAASI